MEGYMGQVIKKDIIGNIVFWMFVASIPCFFLGLFIHELVFITLLLLIPGFLMTIWGDEEDYEYSLRRKHK